MILNQRGCVWNFYEVIVGNEQFYFMYNFLTKCNMHNNKTFCLFQFQPATVILSVPRGRLATKQADNVLVRMAWQDSPATVAPEAISRAAPTLRLVSVSIFLVTLLFFIFILLILCTTTKNTRKSVRQKASSGYAMQIYQGLERLHRWKSHRKNGCNIWAINNGIPYTT